MDFAPGVWLNPQYIASVREFPHNSHIEYPPISFADERSQYNDVLTDSDSAEFSCL